MIIGFESRSNSKSVIIKPILSGGLEAVNLVVPGASDVAIIAWCNDSISIWADDSSSTDLPKYAIVLGRTYVEEMIKL